MSESVTEVAPGIFQLRIPMPNNPLGYTLPYLVTGENGPILIDTGLQSPEGMEAFRDQLTGQLGIKPDRVQVILITHNHPDHYGLALEAKKLTNARTAMHRIDWEQNPFRMRGRNQNEGNSKGQANGATDGMEQMKNWFRRNGVPEENLVGDLFRGRGHNDKDDDAKNEHPEGIPSHGDSAEVGAGEERTPPRWNMHDMPEPDVLLDGSESYSTGAANLQAVWTPGHTPGHLCFYDRDRRILFTGDHILPIITSNVSMRMTTDGDPLGDYLASVAKVGALDVGLVLPAHEHHFDDLPGRVAELEKHHEARLTAVVNATEGGSPKNAYQVAEGVPWDVGSWEEMDDFLHRAAMGETLSHLEHLSRKGDVTRIRGDDSIVRWTVAR